MSFPKRHSGFNKEKSDPSIRLRGLSPAQRKEYKETHAKWEKKGTHMGSDAKNSIINGLKSK